MFEAAKRVPEVLQQLVAAATIQGCDHDELVDGASRRINEITTAAGGCERLSAQFLTRTTVYTERTVRPIW